MARPRLGKDVSRRVQLVINAELLQQIEDWRFAHRVDTTSEAIRTLVETGLIWTGIEFASAQLHIQQSVENNHAEFWEALDEAIAKPA